jgi:hypothetical protein
MTMCFPPLSNLDGECSALSGHGQSEASPVVMNIPVSVSNGDDDSRRERLVRWKAEQSECANSVDSSFAALVSPGGGGTHQVEDEDIEIINDATTQFAGVCKERKLVDDALAEYTKQLQARLEPKTPGAPADRHRSVADIREELRRTEEKIFKAARIELDLLNRSKTIRSKRESMTRRYKRLCQLLESRQKRENEKVDGAAPFVPARLPPVMPQAVYDLTQSGGR